MTWTSTQMWVDAAADGVIALAYFSIPFTLVWFARHRWDMAQRWIAWVFGAFMLACGTAHALHVVTLWLPAYDVEATAKVLAAALAVTAAIALRPLMPRLVELDQINARLRDNEARLRLAQDAGQVGIWEWDLDTGEGQWSDMQRALFGLGPAQRVITRQLWLGAMHPDDRSAAADAMARAESGAVAYVAEFRVPAPGGVRWLCERGQLAAAKPGQAPRIAGVCIDVTERRRQAERLTQANQEHEKRAAQDALALQRAFEQQRAMFENAPDAMLLVQVTPGVGGDLDFIYERCNPALIRIFSRDITGKRPGSFIEPGQGAYVVSQYRQCVESGSSVTFRHQLPIGRLLQCFETSLAPIRDPATGRIERIVGVSRDITERLDLEKQVLQLQRVEVIGRLTAGVAHDFNNLLQSMTGSLELMADILPDGSPVHEFLGIALASAERGAHLTHHLLSYARKQVLKPQKMDVGAMLREMKLVLERTLGPKVRLEIEVAEGLPGISVDPAHFQTALLNLGLNAGHAMVDGGTLTLQATAEHGVATMVVVTVADTGTGMDAATLAIATEPFFTTKGLQGSGLGLSMVNGFVLQSGGDMRIASAVGEGTRVELRLPAVSPAKPSMTTPQRRPARCRRALIVDDSADVLATTAAFLTTASIQVVSATSGEVALAHLADGTQFDVLVTDYAMPGLNGVQTILRAGELQPGLPAIMITGFADLDGAIELPPGVEVLNKPFRGRELLNAIERAMRQDAEQQRAPAHAAGGD